MSRCSPGFLLPFALLAAVALPVRAQRTSPPAPLDTPQTVAGPRDAHRSWTSDRVELVVGDIVTVQVDERMLATAERKNVAEDVGSRDLGIALQQNLSPAPAPQVGIHSESDGSSQQHGESSRSNRFVTSITARVIAVGPSGILQVKGSKVVKLDKSTEELSLTGWIRPEDVSSRNLVESSRVADAQLVYHSSGGIDTPKGHLLLRLLGALWP